MILVVLLSIAVFSGVVLGAIILRSPLFRSRANQYLAYAILAQSWSLLSLTLELGGVDEHSPLTVIMDLFDSIFLFPVFILLFIVHRVGHPLADDRRRWWLFAPYLYALVMSLFERVILAYPDALPQLVISVIDAIDTVLQLGLVFVFIPAVFIYAYRGIDHSRDRAERRWLTQIWGLIVLFFVSLFLSLVLGALISMAIQKDVTNSIVYPVALILAFFIHWITYSGIFRFRLARDQEAIRALIHSREHDDTPSMTTDTEVNVSAAVAQTTSSENTYLSRLEDLCSEQHIYRDNTLDREKVADMLGISAGYLSQTVNSTTGKNFATYINEYRVEEVKQLMADPEFADYSLLAIGLECGFSSKTTFHNTFKKITGMTPNAYRKTHV